MLNIFFINFIILVHRNLIKIGYTEINAPTRNVLERLAAYSTLFDISGSKANNPAKLDVHVLTTPIFKSDIPSNRDGEVEDGQHLGPGFLDEHVADDGGRDGGVARLSDANNGSHN